MPPLVRPLLPTLLLAVLGAAAGCGHDIGDSCSISSDCSPQGDRTCDTRSPGGYCTIQGCDFDSCPGEAICVRFFTSAQTNLPCTDDVDCTADEACTLGGWCAPLTTEARYCMLACGSSSDCRGGYECRDQELMIQHGGEPVLDPNASAPDTLPGFCAPAPVGQ